MNYSTAVPSNHPGRQETWRKNQEQERQEVLTLLTISATADGSKNMDEMIGLEHGNEESSPGESYDPYSSPVQQGELHRITRRGCRELMAPQPMQDDYDIFRRQRFAELFQMKLQQERTRGATLPALPYNEPY
jgi:hypothetical protein